MAIGSGLAASLGLAPESTFGTYVAPNRHLEFTGETLTGQKTIMQGGGLAGGRFQLRASRRVVTNRWGNGGFTTEVTNKRFGLLLSHLMGGTVAPVQQAATTAYLQSYVLADNKGKSLTLQKGVPDLGGTVRPYSFLGTKLLSMELSCSSGETLTAGFDVDSREVTEAQPLASPTYAAGLTPFHFAQMSVKIGAFGSEVAASGVRGVSLTIERPQYVDGYYAGNGGRKSEPTMDDYMGISGTIETDFVDKTQFADRFASDAAASLVLEWVGPVIAGAFNERLTVKLPATFFDEGTPQVGGPGVVQPSFGFTVQDDDTNPVTIEYMSTDVTL